MLYSMDKKLGASGVVLVLVFFSFTIANVNGDSVNDEDQSKKSALWVWQRLRNAYSMYSSVFPTNIGQYWHMVKAIVNHTYAYFFPPNLERGEEGEAVVDNNGAGDKVKEALAKSLGTSKATLEDAAKSAADKVKRSLSDDREKKHPKEL
ncbi:uncharacterized protein [Medicago truncatula]|uniref:Transmembrane protein n=1 Tax=Medicago truncatula TaxID=3880 RepID=A0A072UQK5_MEDTR|nr:uncharacterized protein LOC25493361 isoform X2 [Medicago truncatula]KEH31328.1 hypothetical protein MTR_4g094508 [Medicago truncatula]